MRLGLIARADSRGLGVQTKNFHDHMRPAKTLVIDIPSVKPLPLRRDWYPDAQWSQGWPTPNQYSQWLDGLDAVYTAETPYNHALFSIAAQRGIKTVLHVNPEFLDHFEHPSLPKPTLFAAPSSWMYDNYPQPKCLLPVPVDTARFTPTIAPQATRFLHIIGRPAIHDRAGTTDLLYALENISSEIVVTIRCQESGYVESLIDLHDIRPPDNVTLVVDVGDTPNYWDLYQGQDVLVLPRRFGGLCLPCQEALAAAMPVIMPAISPNEWLPQEWQVTATHAGSFMCRTTVDYYTTDPTALAAKIDEFATNPNFYIAAAQQAVTMAKNLSWEQLKPEYERIFA